MWRGGGFGDGGRGSNASNSSRLGGASGDWELPPIPAPSRPPKSPSQEQPPKRRKKTSRVGVVFDSEAMDTIMVQQPPQDQDVSTTAAEAMDTTTSISSEDAQTSYKLKSFSFPPPQTEEERQQHQPSRTIPVFPPPPAGFHFTAPPPPPPEVSHPPASSLNQQRKDPPSSKSQETNKSTPFASTADRVIPSQRNTNTAFFSKAVERPAQRHHSAAVSVSTISTSSTVPSSIFGNAQQHDESSTWASQMSLTNPTLAANAASLGITQRQQQQQQQQQQSGEMTKYTFVPKTELHSLYGKPPRRKIISADNYHTWHDSGQAHMLKWTSVFVCPVTGELFCSGRYGGATASTNIRESNNKLLWFAKKTHAEHAAAARAFDCQVFRDQFRGNVTSKTSSNSIGLEPPYLEAEALYELKAPDYDIPATIRENIQAQQDNIRCVNNNNSITGEFLL